MYLHVSVSHGSDVERQRENSLLRCHISVDCGHVAYIRVGETEIHEKGSHDHAPGLAKLLENCLEIRSELISPPW